MDLLHEQVESLHTKVDALHSAIEQLGNQTHEAIADLKPNASHRVAYSQSGAPMRRSTSYDLVGGSETIEHKDILADHDYRDADSHTAEASLSSEIQIQRLTAQLTAAYNRIAALEEQLMARRIH